MSITIWIDWSLLARSMTLVFLVNKTDLADEEMFFSDTTPDLNDIDSIGISILSSSLMAP